MSGGARLKRNFAACNARRLAVRRRRSVRHGSLSRSLGIRHVQQAHPRVSPVSTECQQGVPAAVQAACCEGVAIDETVLKLACVQPRSKQAQPNRTLVRSPLSNIFPLDGGCDCRYVRYRMTTAPLFVHCCHCRWCQRETGSAFALNAMIEAERVQLLGAEPEMIDTPSASGRGQKIARCPQCRISVWSHYAGAGSRVKFVRVGTLDQPGPLAARYSYLHRIQAALGRHSPGHAFRARVLRS